MVIADLSVQNPVETIELKVVLTKVQSEIFYKS
jgi:hypothetical protein